jgi:hypothetical protein
VCRKLFYRAIARSEVSYDRRLFVRLQEASQTYPGFQVIDARPSSKLDQPAPLLHATGYRLGRGRYPPRRRADDGDPIALLDDREAGLRAYIVRLPRRGSGQPHVAHKGTELVAVASGLVQGAAPKRPAGAANR